MNAVENQVRELVNVELESANRQFPQFHSPHEGWAVMREEVVEMKRAAKATNSFSKALFYAIMANDTMHSQKNTASVIMEEAIHAACEAIQVAAMAQKFMDMEANHDD